MIAVEILLGVVAAVLLFFILIANWQVYTMPGAQFDENYGAGWISFILALGFLGLMLK